MSILSRIYKHTLGRVLPQPAKDVNTEPVSRKRKHEESDNDGTTRRYQRREQEDGVITKRRRVTEDAFAPIVNGEEYESTLIAAPSAPSVLASNTDKMLMPPPAISVKTTSYNHAMNTNSSRQSMDLDSVSQISFSTQLSPNKSIIDPSYDYDMERARRHAAATTLPENSGVWEESEKELFFHISYRGFEPLLPRSWMTDFRTLPLSLYPSADDEETLIRVYNTKKEFRAIKALRELLDLGRDIRDRVLTAPGVKREDIIDRAITKYIKWALGDAGIKTNDVATKREPMPVHVQVKLKSKQSTLQCLAELKAKMHALRAQHFRARNIQESIERDMDDVATPGSEGLTQVIEGSEDDLPVIYGIMIKNSILAVFTLNSRIPSPKDTEGYPQIYGNTVANENDLEDDSASDPRFISDFDFSDHKKDVWNAFVIAILAMQIRNDILSIRENASDDVEDLCAGIEENSVIDDDPDA